MIRTGYSFKTAYGHLPDVISRLKECGATVAPIADRCSTFGFVRWTKLAEKNELRPVYGVEIGVTPELGAKRPTVDYWTFMAKDDVGTLNRLVELATSNPGKEPLLTYAQALAAQGVYKICGHRVLLDYVTASADFYFGLSPATSKGLWKQAREKELRFIAMSANNYPRAEDRELYRIGLGWRSNTQSYAQHILSDDEWRAATARIADFNDQAHALQTRSVVLEHCTATLKKATLLVPARPETLEAMCVKGAVERNIDLDNPIYKSRLDHELKMIKEKNFEDYFYIVADICRFARRNMVVGPARGSSAGSLACYLLGITAIDPIPFGLLFERFVDVTRSDLPDIDIDFSDVNRQLVFDYVENKYGAERVARLGTVGMFGPKGIFRIVGPALRIPQWTINKVLDGLIQRSGGDTRANQQLEDTLKDTEHGRKLLEEFPEVAATAKLENHPQNASQHAAGIVLTQEPIINYVAINAATKAAMCDKKDAAELNLLKIDALGLKQLSVFERCLELIGQPPQSVHQYLERLPLDDAATFKVLNDGHFSGIFQFMGVTLQNLCKQLTIEHFNDIVSITALARPGPMATGGAGAWAKRRVGSERVTYAHDLLQPYLSETLGIVTYQEQVMKIGREIGGLSWKDVTALRKGMSQSLGQEYFDQYGKVWKTGAIAKGIDASLVDKIWFDLCAFGSWGFNKSHAVAYALVSYWCAYLKAHHPVEFAAATLDHEAEPHRQISMLRELRAEGIDYIPMDATVSTDKWQPMQREGRRILVGPLSNIKGIGEAATKEIMAARSRGETVRTSLFKKLESAATEIDSLEPIADRIKRLHPDLTAIKIFSEPMKIKDVQCGVKGEVLVLAMMRKLNLKDENEDVNVAKRGGKVFTGPVTSLGFQFRDDTDEIYCKIDRYKFEQIGRKVYERGRPGTALYAIKGTVPPKFRMISITQIRYLGDMELNNDQNSEQTQASADGANASGTAQSEPISNPPVA